MIRVFLFLFVVLNSFAEAQNFKKYSEVLLLMGSRFELIAVSEDSLLAQKSIKSAISEIKRIEKLISSWDPQSQTSKINQNAGVKAVRVDKELFNLIKRSQKVSQLTNGIFDISYASLDQIWKFDGSMTHMPNAAAIRTSVSKVNFRDVILDEAQHTVFLKKEGMKIGFGAIGKGYAANKAKQKMKRMGIKNGVVNASGDLICWGAQADGNPWKTAIANPKDKTKTIGWLNISDHAVVTSGNYEKYVEFDGIRYSHIINPRTGMPARSLKSVTIICPDAEIADALATSVFILGEKDGIDLINQLNRIECFIITEKGELKTSKNLNLNYY
jgi:thiamine biosynthesis lipoprotein